MITEVTIQDGKAILRLRGRFDFNSHREFRRGYEPPLRQRDVREFELDMRQLESLDDSALGMLLLLRDRAAEGNKAVRLTNCGGSIRETLAHAHFEKLFAMS
jgi:anti-anti-sigma factor